MSFSLSDGNVLAVAVVCTCNGQISNNQIAFVVSDCVGLPVGQDVADTLDAQFVADVPPVLSVNAGYYGVTVRKTFPIVTPAPATVVKSTFTEGASDGPPLSTQTCGLIRWKTDIRTVGRFYAPFPSVLFADAQASPLVAYLNALNTLASHLYAPIIVTGALGSCTLQLVVRSAANGNVPVVSHVSLDGWATQIRRSQFRHGDRLPF